MEFQQFVRTQFELNGNRSKVFYRCEENKIEKNLEIKLLSRVTFSRKIFREQSLKIHRRQKIRIIYRCASHIRLRKTERLEISLDCFENSKNFVSVDFSSFPKQKTQIKTNKTLVLRAPQVISIESW